MCSDLSYYSPANWPFAELAPLLKRMGFHGLELACWGDHFDVEQAASLKAYIRKKWDLLSDHGLVCFAISNHLAGQAVFDLIEERHREILSPEIWGNGDPQGVRRLSAQRMIKTGKAAPPFFNSKPGSPKASHPVTVNGFMFFGFPFAWPQRHSIQGGHRRHECPRLPRAIVGGMGR